jgi:hypothetical protein
MQTFAAEIAITFVDDAIALVTGCGRIVVQFLMSPIERLARACDVAGVLTQRPSFLHIQHVEMPRSRPRSHYAMARSRSRRSRPRRRMFSFRFLGHLT